MTARHVRIVCGSFWGKKGPVDGIATDPIYLDVSVPPGRPVVGHHPRPRGVRQSQRRLHARHVRPCPCSPDRRRIRALLIPDAAIGTGRSRKYVLVVDDGSVARQIRPSRAARRRLARDQERHGRFGPSDRQRADARPPRDEGRGGGKDAPGRVIAPPARPPLRRRRIAAGMRLSHFFIDRPIFAAVISIVFVILGVMSFSRWRSRNIPEIAPPTDQRHRAISGATPKSWLRRWSRRWSSRSTASRT